MKFYFLSTFLFIISLSSFSQTANDDLVYLDSLFHTGTAENFKYMRIIKDYAILGKESYPICIYYKSGKIMIKGNTATRIGITKIGTFLYFYENGNRESIVTYEKDNLVGSCFEFHENGEKKLEGEWGNNGNYVLSGLKIKNCWNENGIQTINEGSGFFEEIYAKGSLVNENFMIGFGSGKIVNNLKDSIWSGYDKNIKANFQEIYDKGKFISGVSVDSDKVERKYTEREVRPIPRKGMSDFYYHVAKTFNTPNLEGLQGSILLGFVVDTDGSIADIKVLRDLGFGTGEEAIRVLTQYEGWLPGEIRGIKARCAFTLPIVIRSAR